MFRFSDIVEFQGQNKNITEKVISDRKKVIENKNDTETEYVSVEELLNMHRTASQPEHLKIILKEQSIGLFQVTMHSHL